MTLQTRVSRSEFERFIWLPENVEQNFEFIGGEIVEVLPHYFISHIGVNIAFQLSKVVMEQHTGFLTGANGGYVVIEDEHYVPNVGYVSQEKQDEVPNIAYNPIAPDLVAEIVAPFDNPRHIMLKVFNYLAAKTVVWLVYPYDKEVIVFSPGQPPQKLGITDTIDGGSILPDVKFALKDIFPD